MRRGSLVLPFLLGLTFGGVTKTVADEARAEEKKEDDKVVLEAIGGKKLQESRSMVKCPEVCGANEACIHGRCVHTCVPDCRTGTICMPSGQCMAPPVEKDRRTEDELARLAGAESADATQSLLIDLGGIFFLGAQVGYEWGARDAWIARLQLMNTGIMSYAIEPQNEFERFELGFGASLGYRRYEAKVGNLRGFYYGGGLLFQAVHTEDLFRGRFERTSYFTGPYGEFGYRWVFGSLLFGFGPNLSIRVPFAHTLYAREPGSCVYRNDCGTPGAARFEGTLALEIGWLD